MALGTCMLGFPGHALQRDWVWGKSTACPGGTIWGCFSWPGIQWCGTGAGCAAASAG